MGIIACQPVRAPQNCIAMPADCPLAKELTYMALGDSYTIGEGVAEAERWPVQLAARLRQAGFPLADPQIIARTGWTTGELEAGIEATQPHGPFALVTLLIGVNNQYRRLSLPDYEKGFGRLLAQAIAFADNDPNRVIVVSIPDWGVTPFAEGRERSAIAQAIDQFNTVNREAAAHAGVYYVDVTPISRLAANDATLLADDGLHPSGRMYTSWVELMLPVARAALHVN